MIRAGANINEVNNDGDTALMRAILTYRAAAYDVGGDELEDYILPTFETIRFLIYNGANVNIKNKDGRTPLSLAGGFPELTKLLKDNRAY